MASLFQHWIDVCWCVSVFALAAGLLLHQEPHVWFKTLNSDPQTHMCEYTHIMYVIRTPQHQHNTHIYTSQPSDRSTCMKSHTCMYAFTSFLNMYLCSYIILQLWKARQDRNSYTSRFKKISTFSEFFLHFHAYALRSCFPDMFTCLDHSRFSTSMNPHNVTGGSSNAGRQIRTHNLSICFVFACCYPETCQAIKKIFFFQIKY